MRAAAELTRIFLMVLTFVWFILDPWNPGWVCTGLMALLLWQMIKEMDGPGMR